MNWGPYATCAVLLIVFTIVFIIAVIVLSVLRATRSSNVSDIQTPSLEEVFQAGTSANNIQLKLEEDKPFSVVSATRIAPAFPAFTFDNATDNTTPFIQSELAGFRFHPTLDVQITAIQVIRQLCFSNQIHQVGIFDAITGDQLTSSLDNTINTTVDGTSDNGFATHTLLQPITLQSGRACVCVTRALSGDNYISALPYAGFAEWDAGVICDGGADSSGVVTALAFPTVYPDTVRFLASFRARATPSPRIVVFSVGLASGGYGTFPPSYIRGLNLAVPISGEVLVISDGCCLSQNNEQNMLSTLPINVNAQIGVNGLDIAPLVANTWYNVFVIASSSGALPIAGLLSLGRTAPALMPTGYNLSRRLGTVRTTDFATIFDPMQQQGDALDRTTYFIGEVATSIEDAHRIGPPQIYTSIDYQRSTINAVPSTAIGCTISVRGNMIVSSPSDFSTPINGVVRFRPYGAVNDGPWAIGIPNARSFSGQIDVSLNTLPLPHAIEYLLYAQPGTGGSIPNQLTPTISIFGIELGVVAYIETI